MGYRLRLYWLRFLAVLDYCIWNHPFTFMLVPFILHDHNSIVLVAISCILDSMLHLVTVNFFNHRFYRTVKKDSIDKCLSGHLTECKTDLVDLFVADAVNGIQPTEYPIVNDINVFFSDKAISSSTTFSSISFGSIIVLREQLKEDKEKRYYMLAHELGHVQHYLNGFKFSIAPIITMIIELLLVVFVAWHLKFSQAGIIVMLCSFNINSVILMLYRQELNFKSEYEADLVGLNLVENVLGPLDKTAQGKAATLYIKNRITNILQVKDGRFVLNGATHKSMLNCIDILAFFVPQGERERLINRSIERSESAEKELKSSWRMASKKLSIERQIQESLKKANDSAMPPFPWKIIGDGEAVLKSQYRLSAVVTIVFITVMLSNYTYTWEYHPLWIALVLFLVFYGTNTLIIRLICERVTKLMKRIGL